MTAQKLVTPGGEEMVILPRQEYQDLIDARDAAAAVAAYRRGDDPGIPAEAMDAFLAAATPLAFWRRHRGVTQAALAEAAGISQPYLAQLEGGSRRSADIGIYQKLARRLGVRIEDLLED